MAGWEGLRKYRHDEREDCLQIEVEDDRVDDVDDHCGDLRTVRHRRAARPLSNHSPG